MARTKRSVQPLKLFKVRWLQGRAGQYRGFIIRCENEDSARRTHPIGVPEFEWKNARENSKELFHLWIPYEDRHKLKVEMIGTSERHDPCVEMTDFDNRRLAKDRSPSREQKD